MNAPSPGSRFVHFRTGATVRVAGCFTWEPTGQTAVAYVDELTKKATALPVSVFVAEVYDPASGEMVPRFAAVSETPIVVEVVLASVSLS